MTLPERFAERMHALLGAEADDFLESLRGPARVGLRVNTLRCSPERFERLSPWRLEPVPWCPSGYLLPEGGRPDVRPGLHPLHRAGVYYLQEPSAMAVAEAVAPKPNEWVLDLAAAPGGKATQLASSMHNRGLLVANEVTGSRVRALGENLERWGARQALITQSRVADLAERWGPVFDRVLLDAPCSGEGMFRKSEDALLMWSEHTVAACAARQDGLLAEAAGLVRPGGVLVYSTCTFAPEENEVVVTKFLRAAPEFELVSLTLPGTDSGHPEWVSGGPPELARTVRLWPHHGPGEGHFVAKLRRAAGSPIRRSIEAPPLPSRGARDLWERFVGETFAAPPLAGAPLALRGEQLYALPTALPPLTGISFLRAGVWLGTLKKNRFEPSHSLALALTPEELAGARTLELAADNPELKRYLQGDVMEGPGEDGWLVVTLSGFALGWGRRSQGVVKNLYPKGLRLAP